MHVNTELFLTWMSEVGSGGVRDLRERLAWFTRNHDFSAGASLTGRWLRDLSALGHAEIDWPLDRWAIAPAAAVLLPACGGTAVLAGRRCVGLDALLERTDLAFFEERAATSDDSIPVPASLFVQADSISDLASCLATIGVRFVGEASSTIAKGLRQIELGDRAAPPERSADVEHLDPHDEDVRFISGPPSGDGLCRYKDLGRLRYVYRRDANWYHTTHAEGILLDLAHRGVGVIRWRQERFTNGRPIGLLFVDQASPLPPLQSRALVLCSGLPAQFPSLARTAIYRNVPRIVAVLVAQSVHQIVRVER